MKLRFSSVVMVSSWKLLLLLCGIADGNATPADTSRKDFANPTENRDARFLGFLSGVKLGGGTDGVGALAASNSLRILGKVFNYALSMSYGDELTPFQPYPGGIGGLQQQDDPVKLEEFPENSVEKFNDREDKSRNDHHEAIEDLEDDAEMISTPPTTLEVTSTTTLRPLTSKDRFRKQYSDFLKFHHSNVNKLYQALEKRKNKGK